MMTHGQRAERCVDELNLLWLVVLVGFTFASCCCFTSFAKTVPPASPSHAHSAFQSTKRPYTFDLQSASSATASPPGRLAVFMSRNEAMAARPTSSGKPPPPGA